MSLIRTVGLVVVAGLLTTTLFASNGVVLAQRTALDADYVTGSLADAGAYERAHEELFDAGAFGSADSGAPRAAAVEIGRSAVTPTYVENQTTANAERLYAYLHGDRDDLVLELDLRPVKARAAVAIGDYVRDASARDLLAETNASVASVPGTSVSTAALLSMGDNRSRYRAVRERVRRDVRERAVETAANRTYGSLSNDERLALVVHDYDPDDYSDAEKRDLVAERERGIRAALRERVRRERGDELDRRVDERLDGVAANASRAAAADDPVANASVALVRTYVAGVAGDRSYETFRADLDGRRAALASAVEARATARLQEAVPDTLDLTAELDASAAATFETLRTAVGVLDALGVVLPLLSLSLAGLLVWLAGSVARGALWVGVSSLFAGLPVAGALWWANGRLAALLAEAAGDLPAVADVAVVVLEGVLDVAVVQSAALALAGALLVALSGAFRYELLSEPRP